jgi:hypothetical protein
MLPEHQKPSVACKVSPEEWEILNTYCQQNMLTKTEVLRTLIRSLGAKIKKREN